MTTQFVPSVEEFILGAFLFESDSVCFVFLGVNRNVFNSFLPASFSILKVVLFDIEPGLIEEE